MSTAVARRILADCVAGNAHPALALVRLLDELGGYEPAAALIASHAPPGAPATAELERLLSENREVCERIVWMLRNHPAPAPFSGSVEEEIASVRRFFDQAVKADEVASVAAYSLGSPELLAECTREIADLFELWSLLGPYRVALEIGCGIGRMQEALAPHLAEVYGLDVSPGMVAAARRRCAGLDNVHISEGSGRDLAGFPSGKFDLVFAVDSFPYIHQGGPELVEGYFSEVARVLQPGGDFAFLNFSYRGDVNEDRDEVEELAEDWGFCVEVDGVHPFRVWDGTVYLLRRLGR
ncbi:MAG TPA: class I SAM-dependent methyltransferase [Thermoanaerobaculia bacterium]|nr:class I SAM-dependent methyltransferase [Thermoanaerobaculia bacterium]